MFTGFTHSIAGGNGVLIVPAFQSPDYVAGTSGWAVFRDGTCEFNNGTFRGAVKVQSASGQYVELSDDPDADIAFGSGDPDEGQPGGGLASVQGSGATRQLGLYLQSPTFQGSTGHGYVQFYSPSEDGTTTGAQAGIGAVDGPGDTYAQLDLDASATTPFVGLFTSAGSAPTMASLVVNSNGLLIVDRLYAWDPTNTTEIVAESWKTITLDSGWSTLSGHPVPQIRMLPNGDIQLTGFAEYSSAIAVGSSKALNSNNPVAAAYRPASTHYYRGGDLNRMAVAIESSGIILCYSVVTSAGSSGSQTQAELEGIIPPT